jgi:K+-sensing histidine kinase KdpD
MNFEKKHRAILMRFGKILAYTAAILVATFLTRHFGTLANNATAAFSFLIIVLLSAFFGDFLVAITTSITATLCFDYFFLPPFGTFYIASFSDWISLATFLLASVIISGLAASAAENKGNAHALNKALMQLKKFGEMLLSMQKDKLSLSEIAQKALEIFSLEYCSIHVYGEGKWQNFTGTAAPSVSKEVEIRLKSFQDHSTDLMEIADESVMGVKYAQISKGPETLAVLAVKGGSLPYNVLESLAYMIGVQLNAMVKDKHP